MPRKGHIAKRDVLVDPIYNSKLVTRLINKIMLDGKKGVAQNILYNAFDIVEKKTGSQPMEVFEKALDIPGNLRLCPRRVQGRAGFDPAPGLSVPHDRSQHGALQG